jgi:hypothetical protein
MMKDAAYDGPFQSSEERWWRGRLFQRAYTLVGQEKVGGSIGELFYEYCRKKGKNVTPSRCCTSNQRFAESVCYVLRKPVKREYSLPYHPDNRPNVMETARVSFKAIRESNEISEKWLGPGIDEIVKKIREGN